METATAIILKVKRNESAKRFPMLSIKKEGDVGLDVCCTLDEMPEGMITINPGERYLLPTGIRLEIPEGYWASIEARSSTSKQSLVVPKGVIDEGYRGELFAQILNVGNNAVHIHDGDRLIQIIMHKRHIKDFIIEEVDELSPSERGETGFGSTGR
jgi:dUTP pyrophosphatase